MDFLLALLEDSNKKMAFKLIITVIMLSLLLSSDSNIIEIKLLLQTVPIAGLLFKDPFLIVIDIFLRVMFTAMFIIMMINCFTYYKMRETIVGTLKLFEKNIEKLSEDSDNDIETGNEDLTIPVISKDKIKEKELVLQQTVILNKEEMESERNAFNEYLELSEKVLKFGENITDLSQTIFCIFWGIIVAKKMLLINQKIYLGCFVNISFTLSLIAAIYALVSIFKLSKRHDNVFIKLNS